MAKFLFVSVILFKTPSSEGVHIEEVKQVEGAQGPEWRVTGASGIVLIVCGSGPTMKQAQRQALHAWGYLRES